MRVIVALIVMSLTLPLLATAAPARKVSADEARFGRWLAHHLSETPGGADADLMYGYALVDLNGDGRKEAIVWARDSWNCGSGGCGLDVFIDAPSGWRRLSTTPITRPPIEVLTTRTRGWRDLAAWVAGGGIPRPYEARLRFNGKRYEIEWPADWSGEDAPPIVEGHVIIADAYIALFPAKCRKIREAPSTFGPLRIPSGKPGSC
jgi:hypothetical protein